jgi:hypothetical protein
VEVRPQVNCPVTLATIERLGGNRGILRGRAIDTSGATGESRETTSSSDRAFWTGNGWAA